MVWEIRDVLWQMEATRTRNDPNLEKFTANEAAIDKGHCCFRNRLQPDLAYDFRLGKLTE
jgi:hypothetical protein